MAMGKPHDPLGGQDVIPLPWVAAMAPNGRSIATAGPLGGVQIRNFDTGRVVKTVGADREDEGVALSVTFSPDGKAVARVGKRGIVRAWDLKSGRILLDARGSGQDIRSTAFFGNRLRVVSGGYRYIETKFEPIVIEEFKFDGIALGP